MYVEISIPSRGRTCSMCQKRIEKGDKHFILTDWLQEVKYPIKKNVCIECADKISNPDFLIALERLIDGLKRVRRRFEQAPF